MRRAVCVYLVVALLVVAWLYPAEGKRKGKGGKGKSSPASKHKLHVCKCRSECKASEEEVLESSPATCKITQKNCCKVKGKGGKGKGGKGKGDKGNDDDDDKYNLCTCRSECKADTEKAVESSTSTCDATETNCCKDQFCECSETCHGDVKGTPESCVDGGLYCCYLYD